MGQWCSQNFQKGAGNSIVHPATSLRHWCRGFESYILSKLIFEWIFNMRDLFFNERHLVTAPTNFYWASQNFCQLNTAWQAQRYILIQMLLHNNKNIIAKMCVCRSVFFSFLFCEQRVNWMDKITTFASYVCPNVLSIKLL